MVEAAGGKVVRTGLTIRLEAMKTVGAASAGNLRHGASALPLLPDGPLSQCFFGLWKK
jgi:hypothetical protein